MIVIDTHIWLWWAFKPDNLSSAQADAIDKHSGGGIGVSNISCYEVAWLAHNERVDLGVPIRDWLNDALRFPGVAGLAITTDIVATAVALHRQFPKDPADRLIAATALTNACPLVTSDRRIVTYQGLETIS